MACRMLSGVRLGSGGVGERMGGIGSLHGTCILNTTATCTCTSGVCGKYAEINHVKHVEDQCTIHVHCTSHRAILHAHILGCEHEYYNMNSKKLL